MTKYHTLDSRRCYIFGSFGELTFRLRSRHRIRAGPRPALAVAMRRAD